MKHTDALGAALKVGDIVAYRPYSKSNTTRKAIVIGETRCKVRLRDANFYAFTRSPHMLVLINNDR